MKYNDPEWKALVAVEGALEEFMRAEDVMNDSGERRATLFAAIEHYGQCVANAAYYERREQEAENEKALSVSDIVAPFAAELGISPADALLRLVRAGRKNNGI